MEIFWRSFGVFSEFFWRFFGDFFFGVIGEDMYDGGEFLMRNTSAVVPFSKHRCDFLGHGLSCDTSGMEPFVNRSRAHSES